MSVLKMYVFYLNGVYTNRPKLNNNLSAKKSFLISSGFPHIIDSDDNLNHYFLSVKERNIIPSCILHALDSDYNLNIHNFPITYKYYYRICLWNANGTHGLNGTKLYGLTKQHRIMLSNANKFNRNPTFHKLLVVKDIYLIHLGIMHALDSDNNLKIPNIPQKHGDHHKICLWSANGSYGDNGVVLIGFSKYKGVIPNDAFTFKKCPTFNYFLSAKEIHMKGSGIHKKFDFENNLNTPNIPQLYEYIIGKFPCNANGSKLLHDANSYVFFNYNEVVSKVASTLKKIPTFNKFRAAKELYLKVIVLTHELDSDNNLFIPNVFPIFRKHPTFHNLLTDKELYLRATSVAHAIDSDNILFIPKCIMLVTYVAYNHSFSTFGNILDVSEYYFIPCTIPNSMDSYSNHMNSVHSYNQR